MGEPARAWDEADLPSHSAPPTFDQALLSWQDPTATSITVVALLVLATLVFLLGGATVLAALLLFIIRPPALRDPTPPTPASFFQRLPTRADCVV